jgi:DNA invertase Pin-like site-specific DNA recombinase
MDCLSAWLCGRLDLNPVTLYAQELESSLISEWVKAGMAAAKARGKKLGRPKTPDDLVKQIASLAETTDFSINKIRERIDYQVSRAVVGQIVKRVRDKQKPA